MMRFVAVAAFLTGWWIVGAGLLFSSFGDWKIYVYGVIGGLGAAAIAEWAGARRIGKPSS